MQFYYFAKISDHKQMRLKKIQATAGFTLIEIMVGLGMMGILSIAFMSLMQSAKKGQVGVGNAVDFDTLKSTLQLVVNNTGTCNSSFWNPAGTAVAKFNPASPPSGANALGTIKIGNTVVAQVGQDLGSGLQISKLAFQAISGPDTATVPNKTVYTVNLLVEAQRKTGGLGSQTLSNSTNPIRLNLEIDWDTGTSTGSSDVIACNPNPSGHTLSIVPPVVVYLSSSSPPSYTDPAFSGVTASPLNTWNAIDLSATVPAAAQSVLLEFWCGEAVTYVARPSDPMGPTNFPLNNWNNDAYYMNEMKCESYANGGSVQMKSTAWMDLDATRKLYFMTRPTGGNYQSVATVSTWR